MLSVFFTHLVQRRPQSSSVMTLNDFKLKADHQTSGTSRIPVNILSFGENSV